MTYPQFLQRFDSVKQTKKGADVRCPAHADTKPSLGIAEGHDGRILLNCWAGCSPQAILDAMGLSWSDLFPDDGRGSLQDAQNSPRTRLQAVPIDRGRIAFQYDAMALKLRMQAEKILAAATECPDRHDWTNDELDLAMGAVARAYGYQERAAWAEQYADHLRGIE